MRSLFMNGFSTGQWRVFCAVAILALSAASHAVGQTEAPFAAAQTPAVNLPPKPDFRFNVGWVSTAGSFTYVPEKWGELHINMINSRDVARELLCVTYFDETPNLQFGRRVWMPARSKLQISHPVLIPKCDSTDGRAISLHSMIIDDSSSDDVLVKNESGQNLQSGAILVTREAQTTAIIGKAIGGIVGEEITNPPPEVSDLIAAGRAYQQLSSKLTLFIDPFLPADETSLNCYEHIVIADSRVADDFAALAALRQWLFTGGHLWVMLDRVDPIVLERLFGDDFKGHLVDRVGLTTVRIDESFSDSIQRSTVGDVVEYDDPVQMARVVIQDMNVMHSVNGWPASLTKRCGDGKLLITTLGARGWMKQTNLLSPMTAIATDFFTPRETDLVPRSALEPQVREYVGYTVPSWMQIVGTLTCFSLCLVAIGIWLWRDGRLEHLGWIGSGLAVVVSIVLLLMGRSYRHRVPETVASIQIAQAMPGTDDVRTQGLIAVYHPEGSHASIRTNEGGRLLPEMSGVENLTRRMVTTDFGVWHWENLSQPPGLRVSPFTKGESVVDRLDASVTFDENGITGKYTGRLPAGTDAMVATRSGRIGVTFQDSGAFVARASDVFNKDQFLNANLLADEQDRRRRTLEKLLNNPKRTDYPDRPQLMFWTDQWKNGFDFADNLKPQAATLVSLPLVIHRPANGTDIVIPPPMLPYRNRSSPEGLAPSTMWSYNRNEWQDRADPGSTWLSFRVPRELLPLDVRRARMEIKVSGPVGLIEIKGLKNQTVTSLFKKIDPVGTLTIEIDDPEVLTISDSDNVDLGVYAGDPSRPEMTRPKSEPTTTTKRKIDSIEKVNYWRIDSLTLQLWAQTATPPAKE